MAKQTFYNDQLTTARNNLLALINELDEEQLKAPIISEAQIWNVSDIVAHLLENEQGMSIHVHKIRNGRETVPEGFDLEAWNAGLKERTGDQSLSTLLSKMAEVRIKTLAVLATITEAEWQLQGRHPQRQTITIEQYYQTMADHDIGHAHDIRVALGLA